jgi:ribonuclease P protein component
MSHRRGLSKSDRLLRRASFERVLKARCRAADRWLVVYACRNSVGHPRLGIIVSRRHGGAVTRNRLKRMLREAFRLTRHELPAGYDLVCIPSTVQAAAVEGYGRSMVVLARVAAGANQAR